MKSLRCFALGLPKTGTTSLAAALMGAGISAVHQKISSRQPHVSELLCEAHRQGRDPMFYLPGVEAITHPSSCAPARGINAWAQMDLALLSSLRQRYPKCAFVLNVRPVDNLVRSIVSWRDQQARYTEAEIPGLPAGRGGTPGELRDWIQWHWQTMRTHFSGDPLFVEIDIENRSEAEQGLAQVLGVPISWPWENKSPC